MADRHTEADMVGTICDMVDELSRYLDKFHSVASEGTFAQFERAWPGYVDIGPIKPLVLLYRQLEGPE
jgi:hypothetical protein